MWIFWIFAGVALLLLVLELRAHVLGWGLHALLSIDPQWLDDVEELIKRVPYADVIERWFPGWQQMLAVAMDLAQTVLGWVGSNAPLVAWIVWGIGALMLLAVGGLLSLTDRRLRVGAPKPAKTKTPDKNPGALQAAE